MKKPDAIRAAITQVIPRFRTDPAALQVFVEKGSMTFTAGAGLSFLLRYKLTLQLLDFAEDENLVFLAILRWAKAGNEYELLQAYAAGDREGIGFDIDVLDNTKVDLEITLNLQERVIVTATDGGGFAFTYPDEPPLPDDLAGVWPGALLTTVHANDEQIAPA